MLCISHPIFCQYYTNSPLTTIYKLSQRKCIYTTTLWVSILSMNSNRIVVVGIKGNLYSLFIFWPRYPWSWPYSSCWCDHHTSPPTLIHSPNPASYLNSTPMPQILLRPPSFRPSCDMPPTPCSQSSVGWKGNGSNDDEDNKELLGKEVGSQSGLANMSWWRWVSTNKGKTIVLGTWMLLWSSLRTLWVGIDAEDSFNTNNAEDSLNFVVV